MQRARSFAFNKTESELKDDLDEMNYSANRLWFEHA